MFVSRNPKEALKWYQCAANHRYDPNSYAAFCAGTILKDGADGVEKNAEEALKYFELSEKLKYLELRASGSTVSTYQEHPPCSPKRTSHQPFHIPDGDDKASSSSSSSNPSPETLAALRSPRAFLGDANLSEEMNVVPKSQSTLEDVAALKK